MSPIRPVLTLLLALPAATAAHAQLSAYVTLSPTHLSSVVTGAVYSATAPGGYTEATAAYWDAGIGGGVTVPILRAPVVALNMDLRGSTRPGTSGSDSAFFGVQLAVHPHVIPFKPYIEVAGGYLGTRTVNQTTSTSSNTAVGGTFTNKYAAFEFLGGVDYPLVRVLDWRVIEIGAGGAHGFSSRDASFVTLNTGLVFHF